MGNGTSNPYASDYQDGKSMAREWARTHTSSERAVRVAMVKTMMAEPDIAQAHWWYLSGALAVLETWVDGEGA